ncbi:MAG: DUF2520 domain-containing protein [Gemmatimonadaceae bacterium]
MPDLRISIVGAGRLGTALAAALRHNGAVVAGPARRGDFLAVSPADIVILAVPERSIRDAVAALPAGAVIGHCSASAPLDLLAPHERFNLHPLMTFNKNTATAARAAESFRGAACAIDGSTPRSLELAATIATTLGMRPVSVPRDKRALYHAAASMASNYLVTLESAAERLASECGISRAELAPLARASLESWVLGGFHEAISGPVSRGDDAVVEGQREAIVAHAPDLVPLFDALAASTRAALALTDDAPAIRTGDS